MLNQMMQYGGLDWCLATAVGWLGWRLDQSIRRQEHEQEQLLKLIGRLVEMMHQQT